MNVDMHPFFVCKKPDKAIYANKYNMKICYLC